MIRFNIPLYLASKSPRRLKLLKQMNLDFKVAAADIDETIGKKEKPVYAVKRLAKEKLYKAKELIDEGVIIAADTIVVLSGKILGKPENENHAVKMLKVLSGKTHIVYTGFAVLNTRTGKFINSYEKTYVTFRKLSSDEITEYVKTGSPLDKAGAYGIQDDFGAVFVKKINGCYYNVVGLPLPKVYEALLNVSAPHKGLK